MSKELIERLREAAAQRVASTAMIGAEDLSAAADALEQERDELAESERSCREDNQKFLAEIDALKAEVGALKVERDELSNTVFSAVNSLAESRIILAMLLEKLKSPLRSKLFSDCKTAIEQSSKEV